MTSVLGEKLREAIEKKSLAITINQWDDEDSNTKQHVKDMPVINLNNTIHPPVHKDTKFKVTNNASRATFDYVFNRAGKGNVQEVAAALSAQGQKESTVASLCYQMLKNGMFTKDAHGKLFPATKEYRPVKEAKEKREAYAKRKVVMIKRRTATEGIAALKQEEAPKRYDAYKWNADEYIEGLSVLQARELYLKLKEIFGG